mgnify:FL=1
MRQNWQFWHKGLSKEKCEEIRKLCYEEGDFQEATVFNDGEYKAESTVRQTKLAWIDSPELQKLVMDFFLEANRNAFGLAVDYIPAVQFGEYNVGSFYNWHHDINWENTSFSDRKLSIVIQLSDPTSYEGGDFEFLEIEQPQGFRDEGSVLVFPSYNTHRVTEVTKGTRNSLVCWMEGPRWR